MRRNLCLVILAFTLVFAAGISAANNGGFEWQGNPHSNPLARCNAFRTSWGVQLV